MSDKIREFRPDLVGISIVFSATLKTVKHIARIVKQYNSEIKVVVGGPHATIAPEETLSYKFFDYL
ncbi:MAG TPA: cobalamin B12-binding domain-containing protein, partial [Archaeoglobus sp.]|nr:cobalamin B12-binding domain-containing protein [Archaeoglobus sp.]